MLCLAGSRKLPDLGTFQVGEPHFTMKLGEGFENKTHKIKAQNAAHLLIIEHYTTTVFAPTYQYTLGTYVKHLH